MKTAHHHRRDQAQLVTDARRPLSEDIAYRERRYLIMMGIRVVCFVVAVIMFTSGAGWLTAIPAVGAIAIPYFAVVFANGGREPSGGRFRPYEPNLPDRFQPLGSQPGNGSPSGPAETGAAGAGAPESGNANSADNNGAPPQTG